MEIAHKSNNYHYNRDLSPFARINRRNMTKSAACMWKYVLSAKQMLGYQFRRERPTLDFIVDFVCLELLLIIEVDGITHDTEKQLKKDVERDKKLEEVGFTVLRFDSSEVLQEIEWVYGEIEKWIEENAKVPPVGKRSRNSTP